MPKTLSFPEDELKHPAIIEWWYFNGNLKDDSGKQYTYMYCLFKADPKKVKLPFLEKAPLRDFYFSHYILSSPGDKKPKFGIDLFYEGLDKKSFSKDQLFIKAKVINKKLLDSKFLNNRFLNTGLFQKIKSNLLAGELLIEEIKPLNYTFKTENFDLQLISKKPPLLVNEIGWLDLKVKSTYYYSLTSLETRGAIILGNKEVAVTGWSWMDHQWADTPYSPEDKWTWFSMQLNNQTEILCFEYGDQHKLRLASISYPDGRQTSTNQVSFKPLGKKWTSPKTGAIYNLEWEIDIPELNAKIKASPKVLEQEVIFGTINYWEGGMDLEGEFNGQKVSGEGFLEMVGVPMGRSMRSVYLDRAKELLSDYMARP